MFPASENQATAVMGKAFTFTAIPVKNEVQPDRGLEVLFANLTPETPWGERRAAARKLGYLGNPQALPVLLNALPTDPFWMVRCAIIQALELIGDAGAIPTLHEVAEADDFEVVRTYANKAIERLTL